MNPGKAEIVVKWYLRFNGYFIVDNFIVHAGDDPARISGGTIGNYTEVDSLGIRHKYSSETTGALQIQNDARLLEPSGSAIDLVIAEVKTGGADRPNKIWLQKNLEAIRYMLRFAGFIEKEETIDEVVKKVGEEHRYVDPAGAYSIRLIIFSEIAVNKNWKHVCNILLEEVIDFIVRVRGECWVETGIGVQSDHKQWDPLINEVFSIANDFTISAEERKQKIFAIL